MGHDENNCQAYELMMGLIVDAYRIQVEEHGEEYNGQCNGRGGYQGRGRGRLVSQGWG